MKYLNLLKERYDNMGQRERLVWGAGIAAVLLLLILFTAANERIASMEKKRKARESDLVEMMSLKHRYLTAKMTSTQFAGRLAAVRPDDSPARIIDETGIKGKSSRVTPLKGEDREGFTEDAAEVKLEGLSANEAVNLLYRLENGDRPVVVKKANLKTRFDDPARLDLILVVALLKAAPQGPK